MDLVGSLPPGGQKGHNACLVIADRYRKTPIFLQFHQDDTAMDTVLLIGNKVISHTGLFKNIISNRYPRFNSNLWTNFNKCLGTKLSFLTTYHQQTDGLVEIMIQNLEDMIRRLYAYSKDLESYKVFRNDLCENIPYLELTYKTSIHDSTGKSHSKLEKGWNFKLPVDTLKKIKGRGLEIEAY
ncbi:hypothetical protein O181_016940 [Austropuccinia psidii MF-1]|uniref:Integrase catalytic domain-containing protein n=1 Tax=Austropuccinia psidii MF-1 TaxID=1389203 RepID=A0A9Q3C6V7_9BASI|nr:hypothetical protein [Austropuccinia psidii MF-1]